ncbi:glycosyltransferase [Rickettsiales bacterium]|nr:glycosyltransferase [Rickettsiales bacterium]
MSKVRQEITIIILAYKSAHIIENALDQIVNKGFNIKVIDNGSNDNIADLLQEKYANSGIELIMLENNVGFSRGNNVALKKVITKYAFLLNPDAIIDPESIDNLVQEMEKDDKIALANPIFLGNQEVMQEKINARKKESEPKNNVKLRNFICCGSSLMKMNIFKNIGFLDEKLFLYCEDVEISDRSIESGYKNIVVSNAYTFHVDQKSVKIENYLHKYQILYKRNWYLGWGRTYLKTRNKNIFKIYLKAFHRLFLSVFYLLKFDVNKSIARLALFIGSMSYLLGFDCFNKTNKITQIKEKYII